MRSKGRKERATPLTSQTVAVLRAWMRERDGQPGQPLFPTRDGRPLTRDAVALPGRQTRRHRRPPLPNPAEQARHPARAAALRGRLGYVAGWRVSLAGPVAELGSGDIIRGSVLVGPLDGSDQIRAFLVDAGFLAHFWAGGPSAEAVGAAKNRLSVHSDWGGRF